MKYLFSLFFLLTLSQNINAQTKVDSLTALKIITNSIEAMGGIEYLKSIKTLYTDTKTEMEGRQVHWIVKEMLPNKGSFQIVYNNRVVYSEWFDGNKGYNISNGNKKKTDKEEFKDKLYKKNIFNELDYLDSTLWKLEYVGEEKVENDNSYKVKGTLASGLVMLLYFNKTNFHMVRSDKISNAEKGRFITFLYSNFKQFDKLIHYTEMKFGENGKYQYGIIDNLLINQGIDEKDFK
ncbi:MAG: hypothetical protein H0W75_06320 [Chitinophagaceae bacterium]|nr:hypothetical protein [Chitinophagaceae bacterium]